MNRLGLLHPSTLTTKNSPETLSLYFALTKHLVQTVNHAPVTYTLPSSGALIGSYGIFLHTPAIGHAILSLYQAILALPKANSTLTPRTKAIISLVISANERSQYSTYFHSTLSLHAGTLTQNEVTSLQAGLCSSMFNRIDRLVFGMTRELCVQSGALPEKIWNEALCILGRDGAIAIVHFVAFQRYLSTIERAFDAQVPAEGERVEASTSQMKQ